MRLRCINTDHTNKLKQFARHEMVLRYRSLKTRLMPNINLSFQKELDGNGRSAVLRIGDGNPLDLEVELNFARIKDGVIKS